MARTEGDVMRGSWTITSLTQQQKAALERREKSIRKRDAYAFDEFGNVHHI